MSGATNIVTDMRAKVARLETEMRTYDQVDIPVKHYFSQGVYAREMTVPKGVLLTGKIHKYPQLNILSKGDATVITHEGRKRLQAPCTFVAPAGSKRAFYAHEETVWTVVHGTEETDVEKIEEHFIAKDEDAYLDFVDYQAVLSEAGLVDAIVKEISDNAGTLLPSTEEGQTFRVGESSIQGLGLIAARDIANGELIGVAMTNRQRTIAGRYANHSRNPNAAIVISGNDMHLMAICNIEENDEITVSYRQVRSEGEKLCLG